jgi:hypothetical protein
MEVQLSKPSEILKSLLTVANAQQLGLGTGYNALANLADKVTVKSHIIGALQYFKVDGAGEWKFAYKLDGKVFVFKDKETMTKAIQFLTSDIDLTETALEFKQLVKEA